MSIKLYKTGGFKVPEKLIWVFEYLLVYCGCLGTMLSFMVYFGDNALEDGTIWLVSALSIFPYLLFRILKKGKYRIYSLIVLIYALFASGFIYEGVCFLIKGYIREAAKNNYRLAFSVSTSGFTLGVSETVGCVAILMVLILGGLLSRFFVSGNGFFWCFIVIIIMCFVGVFVDIKPSLIKLSPAIACIIALVAKSTSGKNLNVFYVYIYTLLLAVFLGAVIPELYVRPAFMNKAKNAFDEKITSFFEDMYALITGDKGGAEHGVLGGRPKFNGKVVLEVTAPMTENIYLRSFSAKDFDGFTWNNNDLARYESVFHNTTPDSILYDSYVSLRNSAVEPLYLMDTNKIQIIKTGYTEKETFLPYGCGFGEYGVIFDPKGVRLDTGKEYELTYCTIRGKTGLSPSELGTLLNRNVPDKISKEMREYSNYVVDNYLTYPADYDEYFTLLSTVLHDNNPSAPVISVEDEVKRFREYIDRSGYVYSLDVKNPGEVDDLMYDFMVNTKEGFCVHYATFMTLYLRSRGIPARYAEGYIVTTDTMVETEVVNGVQYGHAKVKDEKAHAWCEVFINGYGWCKYEATPANAGYYQEERETELTSSVQASTTQTQTKTEEETEEETEAESTTGNTSASREATSKQAEDKNEGENAFDGKLIAIFVILGIVSVLFLVLMVIVYCRAHLLSRGNPDCSKKRYYKLHAYLMKQFRKFRLKRRDDMSYMEFEEFIREILGDTGYKTVVSELLSVRFGNCEPSAEYISHMLDCIDNVKAMRR